MSDVKLADCRVLTGATGWAGIRPMTPEDLDSLIRERIEARIEKAAHAVMVYSWSVNEMMDMTSPKHGMDLARTVLAALMTEEDS